MILAIVVALISVAAAVPAGYEQPSYSLPAQPSYTAPAPPAYSAPAEPSYYAPAPAPVKPSYSLPAPAPVAPSYSVPAPAPAYSAPAPTLNSYKPAHVPIVQQDGVASEDGAYRFSYTSADNSYRAENADNLNYVQGSYSYYSPEGQKIETSYTADHNGFQAFGDHLPRPVESPFPFRMVISPYTGPQYPAPAAPQYNAPQYPSLPQLPAAYPQQNKQSAY